MKTHEIIELINIRNFAVDHFDDLHFKMTSAEIKQMGIKIPQLNRVILDGILALDLPIKK